jgi:hypothetical protein
MRHTSSGGGLFEDDADDPAKERAPMRAKTGKPAHPFRLQDIDGRVHSYEDFKGNWLLMVFHRHLG